MLVQRLSNLQKIDNLATRLNLLTMFATFIPNAWPRFLQKGPGKGMVYLQISEMFTYAGPKDKLRYVRTVKIKACLHAVLLFGGGG